jgi:hypothetical protein
VECHQIRGKERVSLWKVLLADEPGALLGGSRADRGCHQLVWDRWRGKSPRIVLGFRRDTLGFRGKPFLESRVETGEVDCVPRFDGSSARLKRRSMPGLIMSPSRWERNASAGENRTVTARTLYWGFLGPG